MQLGTVGSGLDVESIVKALVDADVAPKNNSLNRKESGLTAELTAIGSLKSVLSWKYPYGGGRLHSAGDRSGGPGLMR